MMMNPTVNLVARRTGNLVWRTISVLSFTGCAVTLFVFGPFNGYFLRSEGVRNAICAAAERGEVARLERYNRRGAALDSPCYNNAYTPLTIAATNGRADAVAYLLQSGVPPDNHGTDGRTPLTLAHLRLFQSFRNSTLLNRDFSRTSQLLSQAGGTTGNAVSQIR